MKRVLSVSVYLCLTVLVNQSFATDFIPFTIGGTPVTDVQILSATGTFDNDCSGFLVAPEFAITARHCQGFTNLFLVGNDGRTSCKAVAPVQSPVPLTADIDGNDFILVKVQCSPDVVVTIHPFELPEQDEDVDGTVQVAGFGGLSGISTASTLSAVSGSVAKDYAKLESEVNAEELGEMPMLIKNAEAGLNFCMRYAPGNTQFFGDSGGPIYVKTSSGSKVVGLVSMELTKTPNPHDPGQIIGGCAPKLSHYANWIRRQIQSQ